MKIESIIRRKNGTTVPFNDGTVYKFQPEVEGGPHVAEVTNQEHIDRFLSITEGFRAAEQPAQAPVADQDEEARAAEREALVALYVERFDRKPHHKKSIETIRAELAE